MKHFAALALVAVSASYGQQRSGLNARELFYTPPADAAKPAPAPKSAEVPKTTEAPKSAEAPKTTEAPKMAAKEKAAARNPAPQKSPAAPKAAGQDAHSVEASVPLGLRYAVLKRDASGKFQETNPDTTFRSGDRIRIQVDSNTSGYLYVVMQGSSGNWSVLFPSPEVSSGSNLVHKGQSLQIPPGDRGQFVFDEQAGAEKLFLVLTRQPEADLDKLIYSMGGGAAPFPRDSNRVTIAKATIQDDLINRLRSQVNARDLVFEKVDESTPVSSSKEAPRVENAAYVVNPSAAPDARLVVDLTLRHR
jgi:hypothetical protein